MTKVNTTERATESKKRTSRRELLQACFAGALLGGQACKADTSQREAARSASSAQARSKVVIARDPMLRGMEASLDSERLLKLLDRAMQAMYDVDSPAEAWKKVVHPGEVVGLKVNCLAGRGFSTRVQLVEAICERLQQVGIQQKDIVIWDRLNADLENGGFQVMAERHRIRCIGNDELGFEEELSTYGEVGSLLCKTLTQTCNAVINLPALKDHGIAGVTLALKSLFGAIHNPNKYHLNVGDPYVADVYMLPPIRQKVRLTICDATKAQYEGGPSYMPQWIWPFNGLIVARDPVALDYTGWQIIEQKRAEKGMKLLKELGREPKYIATAADPQHRIGTNDPNKIQRVEV